MKNYLILATKTLFFSAFLLLLLGQAGRLSFWGGQINGYAFEAALWLSIAVLFIRFHLKPIVFFYSVNKPLSLFLLYISVGFLGTTFFYTPAQNLVAFLYLFRFIGIFLFFIYNLYWIQEERPAILFKHPLRIAGAVIGLVLLTCYAQFFLLPNIQILGGGWDPHIGRLVGLYLDPPVTGAILSLLWVWIWPFLLSRKKGFIRDILTMSVGLLFIGVIGTYARGTWVAFGIGSVVFFILLRRWLYVPIFIVAFALAIYFVPALPSKTYSEASNLGRTSTISSRLTDQLSGVQVWGKNPVFGIGYNHIPAVKTTNLSGNHSQGAFHSSYLVLLATTGLIGTVLFLWGAWLALRKSTFGIVGGVILGTLSLFDNVFLHPIVLPTFLIMYLLTFPKTKDLSVKT